MVGQIGRDKSQRRQAFHQKTCPPGHTVGHDGKGGYVLIPWARQGERVPTRDAVPPPAPTKPSTIGAAYSQTHSLDRVVGVMADIATRITALELKKAAALQQQQLLQRQQIVQPTEQPTHQPTQDAAPPCACHQHQPARAPFADNGVSPMRNSALAPNRFITHDVSFTREVERIRTRDAQNNGATYGEPTSPNRFSSEFVEKAAGYLPPGSAGRVTAKEINDANRAHWAKDHGANVSGPPGNMAVASDPSERFVGSGPFDQYRGDVTRPSPAALSELNAQINKAKTQGQRDALTDAWKHYVSGSRDDGSQWKPKQAAISPSRAPKKDNTEDAPWSSLYEQNKGTIGADPNKISPGQMLNMPGGGTHTVAAGETLSGIASTPQGTDLGAKSLASERGGVSPTSGNYSAGGDLKVSEGGGSVPTPPTRPSEFGGSAQASEAPSSS